jgi:putative molybdopterin biosynthesis protein
MSPMDGDEFMQVRDVARYLGINEKKVYFLAKAGKIPCTRVTGKWTFPKSLIDRWIEESASGIIGEPRKSEDRSFILAAGSDDPSLGILSDLYTARIRPASLFMATVGSSAGLAAIDDGIADVAMAHLLDPARDISRARGYGELTADGIVAVELFYRELGLLVRRGNPKQIRSVRDLARPGIRLVNRQPGSGTRIHLDQELARARVSPKRIPGYDTQVSTHLEVGLRILKGRADIGPATRTTAQLLGLDFLFLTRERFDMLIRKERFFSPALQSLLSIVGSREFRERVGALGGYDVTESGRIVTPGRNQ